MNLFRIVIFVLVTAIISGCATPPASPVVAAATNGRPAWIDNPGNGAVGSCGTHGRGRVAQEQLAIARAREEFSARFGVSVASSLDTTKSMQNGRSSTTGTHDSHIGINQNDVKAVVKEKWLDPDSDMLWVLVVPSN